MRQAIQDTQATSRSFITAQVSQAQVIALLAGRGIVNMVIVNLLLRLVVKVAIGMVLNVFVRRKL